MKFSCRFFIFTLTAKLFALNFSHMCTYVYEMLTHYMHIEDGTMKDVVNNLIVS